MNTCRCGKPRPSSVAATARSHTAPPHAGTFGHNALDKTFRPKSVYVMAPTKEQGSNLPPSEDLQFFGHVAINGDSQRLTVTVKDVADQALWAKTLDPVLG